jgi:16S rRNA (guanine1207-N2)-methyltransferase
LAHYFTDNRNLEENRKEHSFRFSGHLYTFVTDNGVFSKTGVDRGTEILLEACLDEHLYGRVLDLGCGYGVVSAVLGTAFPSVKMTAVDINPRAVELTQINCAQNHVPCDALVSDGFAAVDGLFSHVITNPPIRAGKAVIYGLFDRARDYLNPGGALYIVIRKQQGAPSALKHLQETYKTAGVIDRGGGFWIIRAVPADNCCRA